MTAVEFLEKELYERFHLSYLVLFNELIQQAKEMEKEQISNAYDAGIWDVGCKAPNFDEYYNRTFKSEIGNQKCAEQLRIAEQLENEIDNL